MKKELISFLFCVLSISLSAQISYESGYFIDNNGQKTDCFIKNIDWKNNPTEIEYHLAENKLLQAAKIGKIQEFGIINYSKYKRFVVNIDRSDDELNVDKLSNQREPEFTKDTLFLKVLVEGEANLYAYSEGNLKRYFYKKGTGDIEQLIYKKYMLLKTQLKINESYKQQLFYNVNCEGSGNDFSNIDYREKDLRQYFINYNRCTGSDVVTYSDNTKKDLFNLTIRPGLNNAYLDLRGGAGGALNVNFGSNFGMRYGVEFEFILPFNKNTWSIFFEPMYQTFNSEAIFQSEKVIAKYNSIEVPVGLRYYAFFDNNNKVYVNGAYVFAREFDSTLKYEAINLTLPLISRRNIALGFGYVHNDKYSVELRYGAKRIISGNALSLRANYRTISLMLGYNFF